jgi:hypothetical protein
MPTPKQLRSLRNEVIEMHCRSESIAYSSSYMMARQLESCRPFSRNQCGMAGKREGQISLSDAEKTRWKRSRAERLIVVPRIQKRRQSDTDPWGPHHPMLHASLDDTIPCPRGAPPLPRPFAHSRLGRRPSEECPEPRGTAATGDFTMTANTEERGKDQATSVPAERRHAGGQKA